MVKTLYVCDRCKLECSSFKVNYISGVVPIRGEVLEAWGNGVHKVELCEQCDKELKEWLGEINNG